MNDLQSVDALLSMLGAERSELRIEAFIHAFDPPPMITTDKENGAEDEFIEFKPHGFGLVFERDTLHSFHLHSGEQDDEYSRYDLPLPMGIRFEQSRSELLDRLSPPHAEGGGRDGVFGHVSDWIRYDSAGGLSIHVEFASEKGSIRVVTVMLLKKKGGEP